MLAQRARMQCRYCKVSTAIVLKSSVMGTEILASRLQLHCFEMTPLRHAAASLQL